MTAQQQISHGPMAAMHLCETEFQDGGRQDELIASWTNFACHCGSCIFDIRAVIVKRRDESKLIACRTAFSTVNRAKRAHRHR